MKFKQRIVELKRLQQAGVSSTYDRTKHIAALMVDQDYRASIGSVDDFQFSELMDAYVSDSALTVLELLEVLKAFPAESEWQEKPLRQLYTEAVERSVNSSRAQSEKPRVERHRVTRREFESIQKEAEELRYAVKVANSRIDEKDELIQQLRDEIKRLIAENSRYEGRISELERRQSPQPA